MAAAPSRRPAAPSAADQAREESRRRWLSIAGVVGLVALVVLLAVAYNRATRIEVTPAAFGSTDYGLVVGSPDAPHEVVLYEDFLCPVCGELEKQLDGRLADLVAQGRVRVEYRPIAILDRFGPYSTDAANALFVVREAAGADVALRFHDLLYADQPAEEADEFPGAEALIATAVQAGAVESEVRPGIEDGSFEDLVDQATKAAIEEGIPGTPTVVLDGEAFGTDRGPEELADTLVTALQED